MLAYARVTATAAIINKTIQEHEEQVRKQPQPAMVWVEPHLATDEALHPAPESQAPSGWIEDQHLTRRSFLVWFVERYFCDNS